MIHSPVDADRDAIPLRQLPKASSLLDVSIDLLIHPFGTDGISEWGGHGGHLTPDQVALLTADEVAFAGATSGDHNIMVIVTCRDAEDFYRYLTTRMAAVPGIDSYSVSIRVRRLKQAASLVAHGRLIPA